MTICLSKISTSAGSTKMTVAMPSTTPLAITRPMFLPRVICIKHRARKPAMVVALEPDRERKAAAMAWVMASRLSS